MTSSRWMTVSKSVITPTSAANQAKRQRTGRDMERSRRRETEARADMLALQFAGFGQGRLASFGPSVCCVEDAEAVWDGHLFVVLDVEEVEVFRKAIRDQDKRWLRTERDSIEQARAVGKAVVFLAVQMLIEVGWLVGW
jgi:hypothetical protein